MAVVPVEVVTIGDVPKDDVLTAIEMANSVQAEVRFVPIPDEEAESLQMYAYGGASVTELLDGLEGFRTTVRGFHPYLIAILDTHLHGKHYSNLFGRLPY